MDKETTIKEAIKEQERAAESRFQIDVSNALDMVCRCSEALEIAKKKLRELSYEPPKIPDLSTI